MKNFLKINKLRIAILFLIVTSSICCSDNKPEIISNERNQRMLYNHFDLITDKYELPKLRDFSSERDNLEIRVWVTMGLNGTDGFIFRRFYGQWSALAIKEIDCKKIEYYPKSKSYRLGKINLSEPKSGWQNAWKKLLEAEILELPDYSEVKERLTYLHGWGFFVEINRDGKYRSYAYPNPNEPRSADEEKMLKIGEIISEEFNLHNFEFGSLCIEK